MVNQFTYTVSNIALTAAGGETYTAAQAAVRLPLSAYYSIRPARACRHVQRDRV